MSVEHDFTVGQIGARIRLLVQRRDPISQLLLPRNLVGATTFNIVVKKPDGTEQTYLSSGGAVVFTPSPDGAGDGSDGLIEAATTVATDLDQAGQYETRTKLVQSGDDGFSQPGFFSVGAN